jgi:gamma-glutamyltranspeptidase/glutathione hydrolase
MRFAAAMEGGRSVGVPGLLRMLEAAHRDHGRLPWARLVAPTIALAEAGFAIPARMAAAIAGNADSLRRDPGARGLFHRQRRHPPARRPPPPQPGPGRDAAACAEQGAAALHEGPVAEAIAAAVRGHANPGSMTTADSPATRRSAARRSAPPTHLAHLRLRPAEFRRRRRGADPRRAGAFRPARPRPQRCRAAHLLAEAGRLAFADRNLYLADADFVRVPLRGLVEAPISLCARSFWTATAPWPSRAPAIRAGRQAGLAPQPAEQEGGHDPYLRHRRFWRRRLHDLHRRGGDGQPGLCARLPAEQ